MTIPRAITSRNSASFQSSLQIGCRVHSPPANMPLPLPCACRWALGSLLFLIVVLVFSLHGMPGVGQDWLSAAPCSDFGANPTALPGLPKAIEILECRLTLVGL
jgi:hypothetical protein